MQRAFVMIDKKQEDSIRRLLAVVTGRSLQDEDNTVSTQNDNYDDLTENYQDEDYSAPIEYASSSDNSRSSYASHRDSDSRQYPANNEEENEDDNDNYGSEGEDVNDGDEASTDQLEAEEEGNEGDIDNDDEVPIMYTAATDEFDKTDIGLDYNIAVG